MARRQEEGPDPPRKSLHCALFSLPPPAGGHRTVPHQCGLPRTGHRSVAEPCDWCFPPGAPVARPPGGLPKEGARGGKGVLVATPCLRGEAGHAWGLTQANQRLVLTLLWAQGALDSGYSPDALLFLSPHVTYVTLRWAFRPILRHRIRNKGEWGPGGTGGGAWAWKHLAGKPLSPVPEPIGGGDLTQAKVFSAPGGRLMRSSHWELLFLH